MITQKKYVFLCRQTTNNIRKGGEREGGGGRCRNLINKRKLYKIMQLEMKTTDKKQPNDYTPTTTPPVVTVDKNVQKPE